MGHTTTDLEEEDDVADLRLERQAAEADHWKGSQKLFQHLLAIAAACFSVSTGARHARGMACAGEREGCGEDGEWHMEGETTYQPGSESVCKPTLPLGLRLPSNTQQFAHLPPAGWRTWVSEGHAWGGMEEGTP